jgi:hypothetical protein
MKWGIVITPVEGEYYNKLCHFYKETNKGKESDPKSLKNSAHKFGPHLSLSYVLNYSPDIIKALQVTLYKEVDKVVKEYPFSFKGIQAVNGEKTRVVRIKCKNSFLSKLNKQLEDELTQQLKTAESHKPFCSDFHLTLANFNLKSKEKNDDTKELSVRKTISERVGTQLLYTGWKKDFLAMKWRLMTYSGWHASPLPASDQKAWEFVHYAQKKTSLQQKEKPPKQKSKMSIDINTFSNKVEQAVRKTLISQDLVSAMSLYNKGLTDLSKMKKDDNITDEDLVRLMESFTTGMADCLKAITKSAQQFSGKPSQVWETVFNKNSANDNASSSENANKHFA